MKIRRYKNEDYETVAKLFYDTVHTINARDYTAEQLSAWADNSDSLHTRKDDLLRQYTIVAERDNIIVGFGSIDEAGCLDFLFVHKNYQGQEVATALCDELEKNFSVIKTYASITAKSFFEKRNYRVVKRQEVERFGVKLTNFEMMRVKEKVSEANAAEKTVLPL